MATDTCSLCGTHGTIEKHHPTGKVAGAYADSADTIPLCVACHREQHRMWELTGLTSEDAYTHRRAELLRDAQPEIDPRNALVLARLSDTITAFLEVPTVADLALLLSLIQSVLSRMLYRAGDAS